MADKLIKKLAKLHEDISWKDDDDDTFAAPKQGDQQEITLKEFGEFINNTVDDFSKTQFILLNNLSFTTGLIFSHKGKIDIIQNNMHIFNVGSNLFCSAVELNKIPLIELDRLPNLKITADIELDKNKFDSIVFSIRLNDELAIGSGIIKRSTKYIAFKGKPVGVNTYRDRTEINCTLKQAQEDLDLNLRAYMYAIAENLKLYCKTNGWI